MAKRYTLIIKSRCVLFFTRQNSFFSVLITCGEEPLYANVTAFVFRAFLFLWKIDWKWIHVYFPLVCRVHCLKLSGEYRWKHVEFIQKAFQIRVTVKWSLKALAVGNFEWNTQPDRGNWKRSKNEKFEFGLNRKSCEELFQVAVELSNWIFLFNFSQNSLLCWLEVLLTQTSWILRAT